MKEKISRLLYLRKQLETIIDNEITETVLRGKETDVDHLRESLIYHMDDNLDMLRKGQ